MVAVDGLTSDGFTIGGISNSESSAISVPFGSPSLTLTHVTISDNEGPGIKLQGGGRLAIDHSTLVNNRGGGAVVRASATADLRSDIFVKNGQPDSPYGAIHFSSDASGSRAEFNTIYNSDSMSSIGADIHCITNGFVTENNILYGTSMQGGAGHQVAGNCVLAYSDVWSGTAGPPPVGPGNLSEDPRFRNPAGGDFHLLPGTPARGAADPSADRSGPAATDFDGISRTKPASMGAYQASP
jgi:hypothetical protein